MAIANELIKKPKACILLLTLSCNLRCKMCQLWRNDESNLTRPSMEDWKGFIGSLARFSGPGVNVIFGGGEPLLFADSLVELISFCKKNGMRTSLATSGYLLDKQIAKKLVDAGLDYIALTLYSLNEKTHNFLRGVPDSHQKIFQAIEYLREYQSQLEIAIDTVIMEPNINELLDLANWVTQDSRIHSIFFQSVVQPFHTSPIQNWQDSPEYDYLWPRDIAKVDLVLDGLIRLKDDTLRKKVDKINNPLSQLRLFKSYFRDPGSFVRKNSCNVINGEAFTVSPDGSLNICPYMKPIGNIVNGDIGKIWYSGEAVSRRDEISNCKKNCHHMINCWYEE